MVFRNSSKVASFRRKPETPALTNSMMSAWAGSRSITITLTSGCSLVMVSTSRRLSLIAQPEIEQDDPGLQLLHFLEHVVAIAERGERSARSS